MSLNDFLLQVGEMLDVAEPLQPGQLLQDIPTYDSLGVLNLLSLYDSMGVQTTPEAVNAARTVQELIDLAGDKVANG